ncbi:NAD(P)-dependent dehydrogenase (short-subunit alcohol dehydrogenase family) [Halarchaeum rubridurum]|uniref:2-deoxy-D-gluconate 3-dehydrogenase n=1 Tax=Halarchaeum rubridurum TaxID=489911 RepID=A0A830FLZ2_9EURY|nr:SDR family NAD(P)-dependent oxidoreductase [Halarchaeum rubridurum]MBP1954724.1 NAD(P)-dependent dehydrogenase (short-subunit alcohol dehydrogenase family) [Halarchaeum rubridurum]GGM63364.1 2-deoxy-D-gluconate 3-dehydrogenase [Halarchaeum rubridurum]
MAEYEHTPVSVADKRAVVVGGTSGIGQAIALGFASEGADVVATSRSEEKVAETSDALEARGAETTRVTCDVTDPASLAEVRDAAVEAFGGIDIVVASQGAISRETVVGIDDDEWDFVTDVALDGVRRVTQAFAPALDEGGSIVNISSLAARLSMANLPAYAAAKGGVEAFTRAAAKELAPDVRVNAIAPGFVITPQNAETYAEGTEKRERIDERAILGRVAERDEIVGAAVYLASDASSYVTGEVITVDGGFADSAF